MSIINTFKTSDDLYKAYPKTKYFTLKDIFSDFLYDFLEYADNHDLTIRNVVKVDVERMMLCKTVHLVVPLIVALNATILLEYLIPAKAGFATLVVLNMLNNGLLILNLNLSLAPIVILFLLFLTSCDLYF